MIDAKVSLSAVLVVMGLFVVTLFAQPSTGAAQVMHDVTFVDDPVHSAIEENPGQFFVTDTWIFETPALPLPTVTDMIEVTLNLPERIRVNDGVQLSVACVWGDGSASQPTFLGSVIATLVGDTSGTSFQVSEGLTNIGMGVDIGFEARAFPTVGGASFETIVLTFTPSPGIPDLGRADVFQSCVLILEALITANADPGPLFQLECGNDMLESGEECDGGECCDDDCTFLDEGAACGDNADQACNAPDTCDGNGACANNQEDDGTACDSGTFCLAGDVCMSGVCEEGSDDACSAGETCMEATRECVSSGTGGAGGVGGAGGSIVGGGLSGGGGCTLHTHSSVPVFHLLVTMIVGALVFRRR